MNRVIVPYDRVIITVDDREAPLGCRDILNPKIAEWLDRRLPGHQWDYDTVVKVTDWAIEFQIADPQVALLFKLTWA